MTKFNPDQVIYDFDGKTPKRIPSVAGHVGPIMTVRRATAELYLSAGTSTRQWQLPTTGHFGPFADATNDLATADVQIRDGYFSRAVKISNAAIPAGGTAGQGVTFSSTANFGVFYGSGAPSLSAAKGSLYLRSDGTGVADRMYVNTDGSTTWTAVATAG
jgi:hypothetical protein